MSGPAVSVIMAAYNGAALIEATLASLSRQTFADFEVLVVDDCSTDATREVVTRFPDPRIRLIALEENGGPVRARNRAVAEARGRYLAALDQDDLSHPERFARQVTFLDATPHVALVGTAARMLVGSRLERPPHHPPETTPAALRWLIKIGNPLVWSSVMVRTETARALDPFTRPDRLYAEDFDLYHRIAQHGLIARLDAPLLIYRSHAGGASQHFTDRMEQSARAVLIDAHCAALGQDAEIAADLIVRHVMGARAVPDVATLVTLHDIIARLMAHHRETQPCRGADEAVVARQTARRWARIVRDAKRAGTVGLRDALALRPRIACGGLAWRVEPAAPVLRDHTLAA